MTSVKMEVFEWLERYLLRPFTSMSESSRDVSESILCGAIAGIVAKTVIAPAERIKMNFQVSHEKFTLRNAFEKGRHTVNTHGVLSLWRGHSTTIMRIAPYSGFSFAIHDASENMFKNMLDTDVLPAGYKFLAGSIGGVGGTVLTYPLDVLRVRLAIGRTWAASIKQGGLYQGLAPTLLGIVPYAGTAWLSKQSMFEYFPTVTHRKPTVTEAVVINALAG
jgi:solute carrier family 25 protein 42